MSTFFIPKALRLRVAEEAEFVPLFNPRQQRWNDHFVWSIDYE